MTKPPSRPVANAGAVTKAPAAAMAMSQTATKLDCMAELADSRVAEPIETGGYDAPIRERLVGNNQMIVTPAGEAQSLEGPKAIAHRWKAEKRRAICLAVAEQGFNDVAAPPVEH